jgi:hypothetical protein
MTISNTASALRPGVCTSATRPTTPYTGQIIYETDTGYLRVWDGSAWDYLSQKQDDTIGLGPTQGLVHIATTSTTGTTIAVDSCFTSTYDTYRIIVRQTVTGATGTTLFRFRASGTPITSTEYYYGGSVYFYNAVPSSWYASSSSFPVTIGSGTGATEVIIDVSYPRAAVRKPFVASASHHYSNYMGSTTHGYMSNTSDTYDGFQLTQDAGSALTAGVSVYGYRKA